MALRKQAGIAAVFVTLVAFSPAMAAPGGNGNGNGNAFGIGFGNGNGNGNGNGGGGGGAPLPVFGVTLLGQAIGAGGLYFLWWRRRKTGKGADGHLPIERQAVASAGARE